MKIKHICSAVCAVLMSQTVIVNASPSIAEINQNALGEQVESTFYQPDLTEKHYKVLDGKAVIEGDIVVGDHELVQMYGIADLTVMDAGDLDDGDDMTANAAWSGNTTWPNGTVPYVISSASQGDSAAIYAGMAMIADHSGIEFVQRTNQNDYIEIIKSNGCWSYVGRRGGRQELSIGNGCGSADTVAHEFMHAIGFFHEQSRSDRDSYVRINWGNITSGHEHNFDKHGAVTSSVGSYDPYSIMHYGYRAFSKNGAPTIDSLIPGVPSSQLGRGNGMTNQDIAAVRAIYGDGDDGGSTVASYGPLNVYEDCEWKGKRVGLQPGKLSLSTLIGKGFEDNKMSSFSLAPGFKVRFYTGPNHDGSSHLASSGDNCLVNNGFNDNISSIYLRGDGDPGVAGRYHLRNRHSGLYLDVHSGSTNNGANLIQWHFHGGGGQQFDLSHQKTGVYVVRNTKSGKALDVAEKKHSNGINVHQWSYGNGLNQQFVLRRVGSSQYYQLIALHSGKSIKIAGGSQSAGANVEQWQNDNQASSHWELIPVGGGGNETSILKQAESYSAMSGVQTEGTHDTGGGLNVGWIDAGDWMAYENITIPESGSYTVEYRVASPNGGSLSLDLNGGSQVLGQVSIPNTGGWQNWTTVSHTVNISAGTYSFGIFAPTGGWNINWFRINSN